MCSKVLAPEVVTDSSDLLGHIGWDVSFLFIPHDKHCDFSKLREDGTNFTALKVSLSRVGISFGHVHEFLLGKSDSSL